MRNLRTQFGKEMGKVKSSKVSGTGTGDVYVPTWKWFNSLDFLRDSISPFKTKPTPGVPQITSNENDENQDLISNEPDIEGMDNEDDNELGTSKPYAQGVSKQMRKTRSLEPETEVLNKSLVLLESCSNNRKLSMNTEDGDQMFGLHGDVWCNFSGDLSGDFFCDFTATPYRACKLAAISVQSERDMSPRSRRGFKHVRNFMQLEANFPLNCAKTRSSGPRKVKFGRAALQFIQDGGNGRKRDEEVESFKSKRTGMELR